MKGFGCHYVFSYNKYIKYNRDSYNVKNKFCFVKTLIYSHYYNYKLVQKKIILTVKIFFSRL